MAGVVAWTIVGAFVFTVLITCLSLVGWVRFADRAQQQKLFQVLIVEVGGGVAAQVTGAAQFNPAAVSDDLKAQGANEAYAGTLDDLLAGAGDAEPTLSRETAEKLVERIDTKRHPRLAPEDLRNSLRRLPSGPIAPAAAKELRKSRLITTVRPVAPPQPPPTR
jgi:hypothetical protein